MTDELHGVSKPGSPSELNIDGAKSPPPAVRGMDGPATAAQVRGYHSLVRLLVAVVVVIVIVLALWVRMHNSSASTVNQTNGPTPASENVP